MPSPFKILKVIETCNNYRNIVVNFEQTLPYEQKIK